MSGQRNLKFYPVRFSRTEYKGYKDTKPRLTPAEINYLRKEVRGKRVIVFDENHYTGKSVKTVARFISKEVASNRDVKIIYNVNTGIPGEWNELYQNLQGKSN
jgi:hypoxanthine phosphoribosyltransferase